MLVKRRGDSAGVSRVLHFHFCFHYHVSNLIFLSFIERYRRRGVWEYQEEAAGMSGGRWFGAGGCREAKAPG